MVNHEKVIYMLYPVLIKYPLIINTLIKKQLGISRESVIMAKHHFIQCMSKFENLESEKDIIKKIESNYTNYIQYYNK